MLGGRMVWVGMSRGRFVGGRNVKAPNFSPVHMLLKAGCFTENQGRMQVLINCWLLLSFNPFQLGDRKKQKCGQHAFFFCF